MFVYTVAFGKSPAPGLACELRAGERSPSRDRSGMDQDAVSPTNLGVPHAPGQGGQHRRPFPETPPPPPTPWKDWFGFAILSFSLWWKGDELVRNRKKLQMKMLQRVSLPPNRDCPHPEDSFVFRKTSDNPLLIKF